MSIAPRGVPPRKRDPWTVTASEDGALPLAEESLTLFRSVDDPWGVSTVLVTRGRVALRQGDLVTARSLIDQALETWVEIGHKYLITTGLYWSGKVALREQDLSLATARFREGLRVAMELESNQGIGEFLVTLAEVEVASGNLKQGARLFGAADDHFRQAGGSMSSFSADDPDLVGTLDRVRKSLGEQSFRRSWDEGKAITPESLSSG